MRPETIPLPPTENYAPVPDVQKSAALRPLLVGIRELCVLLSRSRASLARDDAAGRLPPAIWLNGSKRWRFSDVVLWCELGCPDRCTFEARKKVHE